MRLDVNNLNFSYADKTIIRNLSFSVPDGAFISILGRTIRVRKIHVVECAFRIVKAAKRRDPDR